MRRVFEEFQVEGLVWWKEVEDVLVEVWFEF